MKSKSDWNINDLRFRDSRDEVEVLLDRTSKDMSIRTNLSDQVDEDTGKSQYFDAQENLSDEEDSADSESEYEDIRLDSNDKLDMDIAGGNFERKDKMRSIPMNVKSLPKPVQQRI